MKNNEQWKTGGDCARCRRKNYCGTPCKAKKTQRDRFFVNAVVDSFINLLEKGGK